MIVGKLHVITCIYTELCSCLPWSTYVEKHWNDGPTKHWHCLCSLQHEQYEEVVIVQREDDTHHEGSGSTHDVERTNHH